MDAFIAAVEHCIKSKKISAVAVIDFGLLYLACSGGGATIQEGQETKGTDSYHGLLVNWGQSHISYLSRHNIIARPRKYDSDPGLPTLTYP